ncbi:response regulator [Iningainema tapete]
MALLRENAEKAFAEQPEFSLDNAELEALQQDLQNSGQELEPEHRVTLAFISGLNYYKKSLFDDAIKQYQQSLNFWQHNHQFERCGIILFHLVLAYYLNGEQYREETKYYIQRCLELFDLAKRPDLLAKHINKLGEVLRQLQEWEKLQLLAQKALALHQEYGKLQQVAQDYSFLAEVALKKNSDWQEANGLALQALEILEKIPDAESQTLGFNYFILAQSQRKLGQIQDALANLEESRKKSQPQYDPNLYVEILEELRQIQFEKGEYLEAFHLKQEKREIESQYGLRAFIGAGRLQPPGQVINPIARSAGKSRDISLEDIVAASGRQKDVEELIERIKRRDRKITVIYGPSGVGKSSILQAAFVPALQQSYFEGRVVLPVLVQEYENWVDKLGECLAVLLKKEVGEQKRLNLIETLHNFEKNGQLTVLIFDQFEEFFFDNKDQTSRREFYEFLRQCLEIPYLKFILSLREDYIHCLLEISRNTDIKIDKIYEYILYYLGNFSAADAEAVIKNLTARSTFPLESDLVDQLVKDLTGKLGEVRPIELQVAGTQLETEKITKLKEYQELGSQPQEKLVEKFLEAVVKDCGEENERAAQLVLYLLTSENNTRPVKTKAELGEDLDTEAKKLDLVLEILEGSRLIFRVQGVPERYQLVHDYLVSFIRQKYQPQSLELELTKKELRETNKLLEQQTLTLKASEKELRETNKLLKQQALTLKTSEDLLKKQQEELQQINVELEEKAELLAVQNQEVERKNQLIEQARQSLEEKAEQLALSSKYKSDFITNMSHELRTPLHSLLILARILTDNVDGNLTPKQVEYSSTIYLAGNDLLAIINDILDLAKIESAAMSIDIDHMQLTELQENIERTFRQVAIDKGLNFTIEFAPDLPRSIHTDAKRLQQVLKNLLANAFKFTELGEVRLRVFVATQGWSPGHETLTRASTVIAFGVSDTGIGIARNQQKIIFEVFQQADTSTSRKYGGTGLGLSISSKITHLLGGEIKLVSRLGEGSTFTLYIPQAVGHGDTGTKGQEDLGTKRIIQHFPSPLLPHSPSSTTSLTDDRGNIGDGDCILLIVEDDIKFASLILDMARHHGFKCIIAHNGSTGLALVQQFQPSAIILDISLPGMNGWMVLDLLKHDLSTRHIPVHIMSVEEGRQRGLQQGAIAYLQKPVSGEALHQALTKIKGFVERRVKNLLVVEDDVTQRLSIMELIGNNDVATTAVGTGKQALEAMGREQFDCMVLDLGLPDMNGFELIEQIKQLPNGEALPIIVYTARELTRAEDSRLRRLAETVIVKDVRSPERLLEETALFLHRDQANLPAPKRQILEQLHSSDLVLVGKKVLIVDDDVRSIFALTSMLERYQMQVVYAENGRDGIEVLHSTPDIDVVLMDVMMPEMDGYETTRCIRQNAQFKSLPIIALTAKAMQGDREKYIEAGGSDYITKPVDIELLLSLLRVWLYG